MAKLLLVEDDNNLREIYEARLQAEGYTIVSAKDGEEALVVAKAEKPDLVISDVMMPKISGFEMLDILRNTDELKDVKVIMLTALGQSDDQERADKLGADRYLVKSQVTLEDIVKVTHELLEGEAAPAAAPEPEPAAPEPDAATPAAPEPKPEPAAEPAPPAPVEEPKPEPVPEPAVAATPKPEPDASATQDAAKSTTQEEADVEAKIEDFVAGASSDPTKPGDTAAPVPSEPVKDTPKDTPAVSDADDKLMSDAVDDLVAGTDKTDDTTPDDTTPDDTTPNAAPDNVVKPTVINVRADTDDKPKEKPEDKPADPPEPAKTEKDGPEKKSGSSGGSMDHDRIIKPLAQTEHKKDIRELLADEEAREAQTIPGNIITVDTPEEDKPSGQPAPPPSAAAEDIKDPASDIDPNSIAL